jgi:hypothetical protein
MLRRDAHGSSQKLSAENSPTALGNFPILPASDFARSLVTAVAHPIRSGTGYARTRRSVLREATMGSGHVPISEWLQRIRAEYQEMPGLSLSKEQMRKLWGLDAFVCDALVDTLVAGRVLRRTAGGTYVVHGAGL